MNTGGASPAESCPWIPDQVRDDEVSRSVRVFLLLALLALATDGCGFLGTGDCLKCLGGRQDLREAISAIQGREKTGGK